VWALKTPSNSGSSITLYAYKSRLVHAPLRQGVRNRPRVGGQRAMARNGRASMSRNGNNSMDENEIREALNRHWAASDANDFDVEHDIYKYILNRDALGVGFSLGSPRARSSAPGRFLPAVRARDAAGRPVPARTAEFFAQHLDQSERRMAGGRPRREYRRLGRPAASSIASKSDRASTPALCGAAARLASSLSSTSPSSVQTSANSSATRTLRASAIFSMTSSPTPA
jgi:hypothetical protein